MELVDFGPAFLSVYKRERTEAEKKLSRHVFEMMLGVFIASTVDFQYIEKWSRSRCRQASLSLISYFKPSNNFFSFELFYACYVDRCWSPALFVFVRVNVCCNNRRRNKPTTIQSIFDCMIFTMIKTRKWKWEKNNLRSKNMCSYQQHSAIPIRLCLAFRFEYNRLSKSIKILSDKLEINRFLWTIKTIHFLIKIHILTEMKRNYYGENETK